VVRAGDANRTGVDGGQRLPVTDHRHGVHQPLLHHPCRDVVRCRGGDRAPRAGDRNGFLNEGVLLGLVVGIGYAATIVLTTAAFEFSKPRQWTWGLVDASYHVVGLLIAAIIIALWH
jgi:hypothetical protein